MCVCMRMLVSAGGVGLAGSPGCPSIAVCLSPSTGSICPRRGLDKEANSKTANSDSQRDQKHCNPGADSPCGVERGINSRRKRDGVLRAQAAPRTRSTGQVRSRVYTCASLAHWARRAQGTCTGTTPPSPQPLPRALPSIISKRLLGFGELGLGALTRTLELIARCLIAPLAVAMCVRAGVSSSSLLPQPRHLPPPFRPAAVSEIARRPRIH